MPLIFVYGTLMRGECRHGALADQDFLGEATTRPRYRLYHCGSYPALVAAVDGRCVAGEVWRVSAACLAELDRIEGVDEGLYARGSIALQCPPDDAPVEAYFYLQDVSAFEDLGTAWPRTGSL